jgi:hypothetical protein
MMKKCVVFFLAFAFLSVLVFGCAGGSKETRMKCPKCGAFFTTKQGADEFEWMRGR